MENSDVLEILLVPDCSLNYSCIFVFAYAAHLHQELPFIEFTQVFFKLPMKKNNLYSKGFKDGPATDYI